MNEERPRFRRPWEQPAAEEEVAESRDKETPNAQGEGDASPGVEDVDITDWEKMAHGPSSLDGYDSGSYATATTEEYRGLAAEIARLREEQFEHQAVSATMAGVDSGLVGFEDVTGRRGVTEEDVEAAEQARSSDLALRIGSSLALVGVFLASLYLGGWWFTLFLSLLMVVALGELYATLRKVGYGPLALVGLLGVLLMPIAIYSSNASALAGVSVAATVVVVLVFSLVRRRLPLENASVTVFGMMWVGLLALAVPFTRSDHPVAYVLAVAIITAMADIGSFFVGRGFGSRRLAPQLSPNKTVEGFIGGVVTAILTAAVISTLPPYSALGFGGSMILGVIIAFVAPLGDLAESMIKRSLGVKDMGSILPGHGGMLDRIDGFLLTVPAAYVCFLILGLVS